MMVFAFVFALFTLMMIKMKSSRERMTDWDVATNSYDEDDCLSTWDKLVGGLQSVATFGSFKDIDRVNLMDAVDNQANGLPLYDNCIKRVANYTLVCPDETIYVHGCDGVTYKNACTAERNGRYNYSTENGVVSTTN